MRNINGETVTIAECLIDNILRGDSEVELQRYFREVSEVDWKKMREWVGRGFRYFGIISSRIFQKVVYHKA